MLSDSELQKQIDSRCPCFAKPLNECDCQFNKTPITNTEKLNRIIELLAEIEKEPYSWNKAAKGKIMDNIQETLRQALLMRT